jgi:cytochrome c
MRSGSLVIEEKPLPPAQSGAAVWFSVAAALGFLGGWARAQPSGQQIYQRDCAVCHSLESGRNLIGPTLNDIIGRRAGGLESYGNYSAALKQSDVVWTAETLDPWIEAPNEFIPGNRMGYRGLKDEQRRQQLIEFLQTENGSR